MRVKHWKKARVVLIGVLVSSPIHARNQEKMVACYMLKTIDTHETDEKIENKEKVLCISSLNLKDYPRSVVTFTLRENAVTEEKTTNRSLASVENEPKAQRALRIKSKILARRHYTLLGLGENQWAFGKKGHEDSPEVFLDINEKTITIGFYEGVYKTYSYTPLPVRLH